MKPVYVVIIALAIIGIAWYYYTNKNKKEFVDTCVKQKILQKYPGIQYSSAPKDNFELECIALYSK